jgi:hypothetical protein
MIRSRSSRICSSADLVAASLIAALLVTASPSAPAATHRRGSVLMAHPYPIEAYASFPGGLFHWIDCLAGTSSAKTIPAHRADYDRRFGPLDDADDAALRAFVVARAEYARRPQTGSVRWTSAMLGVFCESATVDEALARVKPDLSGPTYDAFVKALDRYRPRYEIVWDHGAIPEAFLDRAARDPRMTELDALLTRVVGFYDVDPLGTASPRVALVPVPGGYGTHAEAIGHVLLLEIRSGDGLADEASVLVHENSHFLWGLVPDERQRRFAETAERMGEPAARTYALFREAIPTALGQGVADRIFRPTRWSPNGTWYHLSDVDCCAKRIYPAVSEAVERGTRLDEALVRRALLDAQGPP